MGMKDMEYDQRLVDALDKVEHLWLEIERLKDALFFYTCDCRLVGRNKCTDQHRQTDPACGWRAVEALSARIPE